MVGPWSPTAEITRSASERHRDRPAATVSDARPKQRDGAGRLLVVGGLLAVVAVRVITHLVENLAEACVARLLVQLVESLDCLRRELYGVGRWRVLVSVGVRRRLRRIPGGQPRHEPCEEPAQP